MPRPKSKNPKINYTIRIKKDDLEKIKSYSKKYNIPIDSFFTMYKSKLNELENEVKIDDKNSNIA